MAAGDEVSIAGTINIERDRKSKGVFNRLGNRGGNTTGNVSASLKFDIPGLKDFKGQLDAIAKSLGEMDKTFLKLAKAPEAFSKQLESVVKQMKALQTAQVQGNRFVTTGTTPQRDPVGQATAAAQNSAPGGTGGPGSGGKPNEALGKAWGNFFTKVADSMMKRFDAGMQQTIAADVYVSRMAAYAGGGSPRTPTGIFKNESNRGFGFMATDLTQANAVLYQGTAIGAYPGATGRPGQAGQAYTTSIKQMQETMPGLDAMTAASGQTAIYNNVQGIKLARMMLGPNVSPYTQTGERKTQGAYFRDVLNALQKLPRPNGKNGAWSKDDIMKMNFPGSRLNAWLSTILPEEVIPMWMEWAITNAAVSDAGQGQLSDDPKVAKQQRAAVFGRSLALNAQETTNREAQKDAAFAGSEYGSFNARLDNEKKMLGALESIDRKLTPLYNLFGRVPSMFQKTVGGMFGGLIGGGIKLLTGGLFGDPGYDMPMGDPENSLSHLTPDLRKRVSNMMAANPNLQISSAYRDTRRQQSLQGKGPFAPPGKTKHGRGQAVDLGPSSQLGWIAKNARKFGLDSATAYGEAWHVQLMGTLGIGDPIDPSATARETENTISSSIVTGIQNAWSKKQVAGATTTPSGSAGAASGSSSDVKAPASAATDPADVATKDGALSVAQVVNLLHGAGFTGQTLVTMAGIANRESGWTPAAHRTNNKTRDDVGDFGLLQVNYKNVPGLVKAGIINSVYDLLDPVKNVAAAYYLSKGGSNLSPWNAVAGKGFDTNGSPTAGVKPSALQAAQAAAQAAGYLGDVGYAAPASGGNTNVSVAGGSSITFNNSFQLSFPNGTSKNSIDTAVKQIAQRLEPQMRRMVSRTT